MLLCMNQLVLALHPFYITLPNKTPWHNKKTPRPVLSQCHFAANGNHPTLPPCSCHILRNPVLLKSSPNTHPLWQHRWLPQSHNFCIKNMQSSTWWVASLHYSTTTFSSITSVWLNSSYLRLVPSLEYSNACACHRHPALWKRLARSLIPLVASISVEIISCMEIKHQAAASSSPKREELTNELLHSNSNAFGQFSVTFKIKTMHWVYSKSFWAVSGFSIKARPRL